MLYAIHGAVRLGVESREWLLPSAFAAWIPSGTPIAFDLPHSVTTCSVLFEPGFCAGLRTAPPGRPTIFAMSTLAREMALHARRWGLGADWAAQDEDPRPFFEALAGTVAALARSPVDIWRPASTDDILSRALAHTEAHLHRDITLAEVATEAATSERTLLRRYTYELGMTWAQSLRRLRMIAATERLVTTDDPVTSIAYDVGYQSLSAFNEAFRAFAGTTPTEVRRRSASR